MSAIVIAVTFDTASRRKDRSVRLSFTSNSEISPEDYMVMDKRVLSEGWLAFAENPTEMDIPVEPAPSKEGKSKGQRMRAVFYLIWKKRGIDEAFDPWYDRQFERYMDNWKGELE